MSAIRIYSASAGSGKTFTLVKEYLKILFKNADVNNFYVFRRILAITFTNKATEEMKQRVIGTLKEIAAGEEPDLLTAIRKELPGVDNFSELADKLLIRMLHDFSNFNIQTIDSFFQDIIRSFARELDLPLNFEIELDTNKGLEFAADEVISAIGFDEEVTKWLEAYALSLMNQDKNWNFRQHLLKISREVFDDKIDLTALKKQASSIPGIKDELNKIIRSVQQKASGTATEALEMIARNDIPESAFAKSWLTNMRKVVNDLKGLTIPITKSFRAELCCEKPPYLKASISKYAAEINLLNADGFEDALLRLHDILTIEMGVSLAAKEALFNIYALGVIDKINAQLIRFRAENNLLFIMDAARMIKGFIRLTDMPFLFEKTGSRINYLFIDEFQDTSTLQWENVLPVLHNILSTAQDEMTVMLVGDAKQSIYRWRGGDYQLITGKASASLHPYESETLDLDTNYRSLPEIIQFNDSFFETVKSLSRQFDAGGLNEEIASAYRSVEQAGLTYEHPGHINIHIVPKASEGHWKTAALERLDEQLENLRKAGYSYDEIAILVNRRSEGVEISRHLQRNGIEVLSGETLLLKFDPDVRLLLAGLHYINQPDVSLYYVNLLWHYTRKTGQEDISKSVILSDHKERSLLVKLLPVLKERLSEIRNLPSYQLVELLISELGLDQTENLFIHHFRQLAFEFFKRESAETEDLIEWWEDNKDKAAVNLDEGSGRVHVVTIHKSKGLEFPVVLIPFCEWNIYEKLHETLMWLSDEQLLNGSQLPVRATKGVENSIFGDFVKEEKKYRWVDSLNVLYVAFTRAREALYVTCPEAAPKDILPTTVAQLIGKVMKEWDELEENTYESGRADRPERGHEDEDTPLQTASRKEYKPYGIQLKTGFDTELTRIGKLVHSTMQYYGALNADDAFKKAARSESYSREEIIESKAHVDSILKMEELKNWLKNADETWSEQDIWHDGKLLRPDKIVRLNDRLIIVDFKTGEIDNSYRSKMDLYKKAVQAVFPNDRIEGYILYTEKAELEKVG